METNAVVSTARASWSGFRNCIENSDSGTRSGMVCSLLGKTQVVGSCISPRKHSSSCLGPLLDFVACNHHQKLQRRSQVQWRCQRGKAVLKQGAKAAGKDHLAEEDLYEAITADEDEFHNLTKKGTAYWSDLMQAISIDEGSHSRQESFFKTKDTEGFLDLPEGAASDVRSSKTRRATTSDLERPDRGLLNMGAQDLSEDSSYREALLSELKIPLKQLVQFERKGHGVVRKLVPEAAMEAFADEIWSAAREQELDAYRHRVAVLCPGFDASSIGSVEEALDVLSEHGTDELGFVQMFNMHRHSRAVWDLVSSPRLARVAADLLGAPRVRLYQDCLFLKQPGFGATNWHSDLNMVPLDTNSFVTLWIPLRAMDENDSGLLFASGSHRDFSLAYWQSEEGMEDLEQRAYPLEEHGALELGDATCHHGWCLHYAMPQPDEADARAALSISYFADGARVLNTRHARRKPHDEDAWSYRGWRQALQEGDLADHPLLPLVYPPVLDKRPAESKKRQASHGHERQYSRHR